MYLKYKNKKKAYKFDETKMEEVKTSPLLFQGFIDYCLEQQTQEDGPKHHAGFFPGTSPSQRDGSCEKVGLCHELYS